MSRNKQQPSFTTSAQAKTLFSPALGCREVNKNPLPTRSPISRLSRSQTWSSKRVPIWLFEECFLCSDPDKTSVRNHESRNQTIQRHADSKQAVLLYIQKSSQKRLFFLKILFLVKSTADFFHGSRSLCSISVKGTDV